MTATIPPETATERLLQQTRPFTTVERAQLADELAEAKHRDAVQAHLAGTGTLADVEAAKQAWEATRAYYLSLPADAAGDPFAGIPGADGEYEDWQWVPAAARVHPAYPAHVTPFLQRLTEAGR